MVYVLCRSNNVDTITLSNLVYLSLLPGESYKLREVCYKNKYSIHCTLCNHQSCPGGFSDEEISIPLNASLPEPGDKVDVKIIRWTDSMRTIS
jgi:hypothetical protein